jgi:hypothetical protein
MDENTGESTRGNIGNQIFDQIEKYVGEEGLSRTQAFQRLSEETGRRAGTVAANYYRVARQRGAELQPRTPRGARARRGNEGAEAALGRAQEALTELGRVIADQQRQIESMREQAEQFEKLRKLVAEGM